MEFPKMLYRAAQPFEDQEALKLAVHSGVLKTMIVESAAEQKAAAKKGWTEDLSSLVKGEAEIVESAAEQKAEEQPKSEGEAA